MSRETWLPVLGYEGCYEVSSRGRVRSLDRTVVNRNGVRKRLRGRDKRQYLDPKSGYLRVNLGNGTSNGAVRKVHQLVAEAFLGARPLGLVVRHLNGNSVDNRECNLRWGTSAENSADTVLHGRNRNAAKTQCGLGHPLVAPNLVAAVEDKGRRACLACHRARAAVAHWRRKGVALDYQAVSDQYFNGELDLYALGRPEDVERDPATKSKNQYSGKPDCIRGHRLVAPNLVQGQAAKGIRACRACHQGRAQVRARAKAGQGLDVQVAADQCYAKIMHDHDSARRVTELCVCGDNVGRCSCA